MNVTTSHSQTVSSPQIPPRIREPVTALVNLLSDLHGRGGLSVAVYGSSLTPQVNERDEAVQTVLVLEQIDLRFLHRLSEHGPRLGKQGLAAPLVMTPAYLKQSLDSFPLELLEIQQSHVQIVGQDHFVNLPLEAQHVRLECERELKRMLIGLRQGLLTAGERDSMLQAIIDDAADNLLRTLRGMLWLKGDTEFLPAFDLVAKIETLCGRTFSGVDTVIARHVTDIDALFDAFYRDVESLSELVNAW